MMNEQLPTKLCIALQAQALYVPPRPEVGQIYHTEILKVPAEVCSVSLHYVVCDGGRVYGRDTFARLFMGWNP